MLAKRLAFSSSRWHNRACSQPWELERAQQMLKVSEEVVALRSESNRALQQVLLQGAALKSQAAMATAQEYDAKALLLQSQLDYSQAHDEFIHAMDRTPE
jgi:hypothetical protein